jgi:hypothetical protein
MPNLNWHREFWLKGKKITEDFEEATYRTGPPREPHLPGKRVNLVGDFLIRR